MKNFIIEETKTKERFVILNINHTEMPGLFFIASFKSKQMKYITYKDLKDNYTFEGVYLE